MHTVAPPTYWPYRGTMCWGWLESRRWRRLTDGTVLTRWRGLRRFTSWLLAEANLPAVRPSLIAASHGGGGVGLVRGYAAIRPASKAVQ